MCLVLLVRLIVNRLVCIWIIIVKLTLVVVVVMLIRIKLVPLCLPCLVIRCGHQVNQVESKIIIMKEEKEKNKATPRKP